MENDDDDVYHGKIALLISYSWGDMSNLQNLVFRGEF